jgi:hypothetical protein
MGQGLELKVELARLDSRKRLRLMQSVCRNSTALAASRQENVDNRGFCSVSATKGNDTLMQFDACRRPDYRVIASHLDRSCLTQARSETSSSLR